MAKFMNRHFIQRLVSVGFGRLTVTETRGLIHRRALFELTRCSVQQNRGYSQATQAAATTPKPGKNFDGIQ